ncbi:MAG: hypothetical protein IPM89_03390 [Candidatus Competibacteraceae bacterium]|nr:MAG: hypothetical protein IPM89_03390 [Candidatus Competibacteraceae bacterium]
MFLITLAVLWLVSPIILLIALVVTRHRLKEARQRLAGRAPGEPAASVSAGRSGVPPPMVGGGRHIAPADLENLLLLRLELQRLPEAGTLTEERREQLTDALDGVWARHLREGGVQADGPVWRGRRAEAWSLLAQALDTPLGPPPWQPAISEPVPVVPEPEPVVLEPAPSAEAMEASKGSPRAVSEPVSIPSFQPPASARPLPSTPPIPDIPRKAGKSAAPSRWPAAVPTDDWRPAVPSPLEKMLHVLSGWPKLIAPFLAQNIGWFVGGFCFVAGALFLIANTSGFVNALVVFASLFSTTAFLLWAGYQFRRKGSDLIVASSVLLTLAMLLAPLDLAVAVRLASASGGDGVLLAVSLTIAAVTLAAYVWAATLASALVDRALPGRYAHLLAALAAVQLAAPLAAVAPDWWGLAALHVVLLVLLGYGLWTFTHTWLRRLFVDQKRTAYYAAGVLVYTAAVSFVHLSWIWPESPPAGYSGPLLMALCGLLFPVDAAFKEWVNKYTFLSRFSFALYALSAVAVAVAIQSTPATLLTLALGAMLYGWMTWRYRTLPPLYLLFGCVAGLYGFGIVAYLPPVWHGLASLPGLAALLGVGRWAGSRSRAIALQCLIVFGIALVGVTVWSLLWARPGELSFATATAGALLGYFAVRLALALPAADPRWAYADAGVVALAATAVAYAPVWMPFAWEIRTAFGLLALAALWSGLGLHDHRQSAPSRTVFIAAALLNVVLAVALGAWLLWPALLGRLEPILLLALAGGLLLWLSLGLRRQALIYGVLACVGGIAMLIKRGYFPGPSTGLGPFAGVLLLWSLLWWLAWRFSFGGEALQDQRVIEKGEEWLPETPERYGRDSLAWVRVPLEQAMALLWVVGLAHLGLRLLDGVITSKWAGTAGLATLSGLLLVGYFHVFRWMALPMLLGLAGLLVGLGRAGLPSPWLGAVAVLYVLLVWRLVVVALDQPLTWRLARMLRFTVPGGADGRRQVEESLHYGVLCVAALPVAAGPVLGLLGAPALELLPALTLSLLSFVLLGWRYRLAAHAYAALATVTVGVWLTGFWLTPAALFGLGQPLGNGMLSLGMALAAIGLETKRAAPLAYWRGPLRRISGLLYVLALMGAVLGFLVADPRLPILLALLCIALFPVVRPLSSAAAWRGLGLALLLSALVWNVANQAGFNPAMGATMVVAWGYALWFAGNLLLPRWNSLWPNWAVTPALWPLLGLMAVLGAGAVAVTAGSWSPAVGLAGLAPYLFLLSRNTDWSGIGWLAVAALTAGGLLVTDVPVWNWLGDQGFFAAIRWQMAALVWLNGLFLLARLWRRHGRRLAQWLRWRRHDLAAPLFGLPFAVLILLLAHLLALEFGLLWSSLAGLSWLLTGSALLLAATAGHACTLRLERWPAQVLLTALGAVVLAVLLDLAVPPSGLPLAVALWNAVLLLTWRYGSNRWAVWRHSLEIWLVLLPAIAVTLLAVVPGIDGGSAAATLGVLALAMLAQGWWREDRRWLQLGVLLALAGGYAVWLGDVVSFAALAGLAPWYAAQTVLLMLGFMAVRRRVTTRLAGADPEADAERFGRWYALEQAIDELIPWLLSLSGLWLGLHAYVLVAYLAGLGPASWHFGVPADPLAAGTALALLAGLAAVRAWRRPDQPNWIYAAALALGLLAGYGRLVVLGLAPFTPWDTAGLLAAAAAAFLLHQFTGLQPLYRLALLLPVLAVATAPWQLASAWTGGALLAAAVLYLSLAGTLCNPWPLYLGVLALNGAVYLWAPLWAERYGLWQFYIVPGAVSVLALLHLHRRELRPKVLNGARLAALSVLYAGAGLDVFLRPELSVFVLALALALTGIVAGIALRIRAFLYAGVAFLVLNVIGQLLRFYPEQGLSRALILLGLGAAITVGMVVFNLKREVILRRIRIARADLAGWE